MKVRWFAIASALLLAGAVARTTSSKLQNTKIDDSKMYLASGQILQVDGDARIERNNNRTLQPKTGTLVYPKDRLMVGRGQIAIQCADLTLQTIYSDRTGSNVCASSDSQSECTSGIDGCPSRGDAIAAKDRENEAIPYLLFPQRTLLLEANPTVRWNATKGSDRYTILLREEGKEVWQTTLEGRTQIDRFNDFPLIADRYYEFAIEAEPGLSSSELQEKGQAGFVVLASDDADRVKTERERFLATPWNDRAKSLAIANLYIHEGLLAEAIAMLESMTSRSTIAAPIYRKIGDIYWELNLFVEARDFYLQAIEKIDVSNWEERAITRDRLGQTYLVLEKSKEAIDWLEQAKADYEKIGNRDRILQLDEQLKRLAERFAER